MTQLELPTLEDVAKAALVSTATVSRCLNTPERVAAKTLDKVLEAVKTLGYSPNFGARALAAKRTNTFGAVIPTMDNAIFARGLQAFQEELVKNGATLLVASSSYDPEIEEEQIRALVARGADGLLLIGTERSPDIYQFIEDRQIPMVICWAYSNEPTRSYVGFDNYQATFELAERAIKFGHRKFGFISAHQAGNDRARERIRGVIAALNEHNIDASSMDIIESHYSIAAGGECFKKIMETPTPPTIVMCGNDVLAAGAAKMGHEMGLNIPNEVSITGFDNLELATILEPALTTVHVPHREMGKLAAGVLLQNVNDRSYRQHIKLPTSIVEGSSLGPVS